MTRGKAGMTRGKAGMTKSGLTMDSRLRGNDKRMDSLFHLPARSSQRQGGRE